MRNVMNMPFFRLFMPKRKSRGTLWASLIGLGVSAAVLGVTRGKRKDLAEPLKENIKKFVPDNIKNIMPRMNISSMDDAALTEYSEELLQSALNNNNGKTTAPNKMYTNSDNNKQK